MFTVYRCVICEEAYLGTEKPGRCPFCGAGSDDIFEEKDYKEPVRPELSPTSRKNVEATLGFEVSNASFYQCAADKAKAAGKSWHYAMWKRLSRVESEHASIAAKLLGIAVPPLDCNANPCSVDFAENLTAAAARETNAFTHYTQFKSESVEPRLVEIFTALMEIETDHLGLETRLKTSL
jgi:rubrerythrin